MSLAVAPATADLPATPAGVTSDRRRARQRGQVLPLFAASIGVIMALIAVVIDVAWYWSNTLEVQRAADAAALAGAPRLPSDPGGAFTLAYNESAKNGYRNGVGGVVVTPSVDPSNTRRLKVQVRAPVGMFFMRVIGINSINATRSATAEFVLPVPMGSPQNWYGVFGLLRTPGGGTTVINPTILTTWHDPTVSMATAPNNGFTTPDDGWTDDGLEASKTGFSGTVDQGYGGFGFAIPGGAIIDGLQVELETRSSAASGCQFEAELSSNATAGTPTWTNTNYAVDLTDAGSPGSGTVSTPPLGGAADPWGRAWSVGNVNGNNLGVRISAVDNGGACTATDTNFLDYVRVRVAFHTTSFVPDSNVRSPYNDPLGPQGFWGTMISQGAEKVNGDAYLAQWDTRTSSSNCPVNALPRCGPYQPDRFYSYGIEVPAGGSAELWIFDPVFCATSGSGQYGTGDRWFGGSNQAMSAYYELFSTNNTPYDYSDDTLVASSGSLFANIRASDQSLNGPAPGGSISNCAQSAGWPTSDGRYYHNRWWQMAGGLSGGASGRVYRLHTTTSGGSYVDGNGHNSFSLWTSSGRIYGLGAMQAFTPVEPPESAEFYLAQIDAVHRGKTIEIRLWDPGDMGSGTAANLQILQPTGGGSSPIAFSWSSEWGTSNSSRNPSCNGASGSGSSVTTNTGSSSLGVFNGCWITITIPIPSNYSAPDDGWWKIRYNFPSGTNPAYDLTTWEVTIRGKPVHLVP